MATKCGSASVSAYDAVDSLRLTIELEHKAEYPPRTYGHQRYLVAQKLRGIARINTRYLGGMYHCLFSDSSVAISGASTPTRPPQSRADILACCFNGSELNFSLSYVWLECCSFIGCNFNTVLEYVKFTNCWFDNATFAEYSYLRGVHFKNCSILGMDISDVRQASFTTKDCRIDESLDRFEVAPDDPDVRMFQTGAY